MHNIVRLPLGDDIIFTIMNTALCLIFPIMFSEHKYCEEQLLKEPFTASQTFKLLAVVIVLSTLPCCHVSCPCLPVPVLYYSTRETR